MKLKLTDTVPVINVLWFVINGLMVALTIRNLWKFLSRSLLGAQLVFSRDSEKEINEVWGKMENSIANRKFDFLFTLKNYLKQKEQQKISCRLKLMLVWWMKPLGLHHKYLYLKPPPKHRKFPQINFCG